MSNEQTKYLEELKQVCTQPSVSAENRGMEEMVAVVETKLKELGADTKVVRVKKSYPFVLAELKAKTNSDKKKTVLIYNHYDVQPEDPVELWETPPFEPTEKDGNIYVRGISDNKGNLIMRIQAIRQLLDKNNGDLPVNIKWLIEGEEEIGSPHLHDLQQEYGDFWKDADVCIWETGGVTQKGEPRLRLGMKGIAYIELTCEFHKNDLHSGDAAIFDSPVWRLIHALSTIRDSEGKVLVDDIYQHALQPTPQEIELIRNSDFDTEDYMTSSGAEKSLKPLNDTFEFQKQMYFTCTANICGIWAGYTAPGGVKTIIPNKATAKMDFRLIPNQTVDDVLEKLRKHLDKRGFNDVKINYLIGEEYGKSKIENEYIQKALTVLEETYNKKPHVVITTLGSGPIHYISGVYDIPVVQIGVNYSGSKAHAPNEHIRIKDYFKGFEAFTRYLESI